jgi:hypothetical protein
MLLHEAKGFEIGNKFARILFIGSDKKDEFYMIVESPGDYVWHSPIMQGALI